MSMSCSLAISPGILGVAKRTRVIYNANKAAAVSPTITSCHDRHRRQQQQQQQQPKLMSWSTSTTAGRSRREAIGLGLALSLVNAGLLQAQSAAAETAPCELRVAASGLAYCDKVVGTGPEPVKGQLIKAHYVGKLENGKVFDSSYNRGKPLTFRVGVGEVIKGWDEGILGGDGVPPMLAGGKRILKLPPELGYGMRGAGCKGGSCIIPPDSVLLFDVEFIGKA